MKYEIVMGLEVHIELATESKLFCSCGAKSGADANRHVCPACAGMPGYFPVANKKAIEFGMMSGIVTNCEVSRFITFDKKNYFYPDLPTGYQITQLLNPIAKNGFIEIKTKDEIKKIRIKQIHIEEDAGKLVHDARTGSSLVDFNRGGVPLNEIVSMADFRTADEVIAYLEKIKELLSYAGISECKMENGTMRCDVNISVREFGVQKLGTRTEIKNMNSLTDIVEAIEYESNRHIEAIENKTEILVQETRRWDDVKKMTYSMRSKEDATDYRYFPDANIMPINISEDWFNEVKAKLPELAHEKRARYAKDYNLSEYDCEVLTGSKNLSDIFDDTVKHTDKPKDVSNWLTVELMNIVKNDNKNIEDVKIEGKKIAELIELVEKKVINRTKAKEIFLEIYKNNVDPKKFAEQNQLGMISDTSQIEEMVKTVLASDPKSVDDYKKRPEKILGFFVGIVMGRMKGKADPEIVNKLLKEYLEK